MKAAQTRKKMSTPAQFLMTVLLIGLFLVKLSGGTDLNQMTLLYNDLTKSYNRFIRPITQLGEPVNIFVAFSLASIQSFDDLSGLLKMTSTLSMRWVDSRLEWDPSRYGNLSSILFAYSDIWVPNFVSLNAPDHRYLPGLNGKIARINYDGMISVQSLDPLHVICSVDVQNFPYDSQSCSLDIYPWGYSATEVKFTYDDNDTFEHALLGTSLIESSAWDISEPKTRVNTEGNASALFIMITFTRRFTYAVVNMIVPVFILSLLNTWVFILPPESGERISYSITVFLSFAIYMTILSGHMPRGSDPLPALNYKMILSMIYSVSILFCTVVSLLMFNNMNKKPVPVYLQKIVRILSLKFKRRCCVKTNAVSNNQGFNGRRLSNCKLSPDNNDDVINAQNPYINNQRRASVVIIHQSSTPAFGENDHAIRAKQESSSEDNNGSADDNITWFDVGSTFDVYMLIVHLTWWLILVILQCMSAAKSFTADI